MCSAARDALVQMAVFSSAAVCSAARDALFQMAVFSSAAVCSAARDALVQMAVFSSAAVCSAARDALVQMDSSAAVKVMALLTLLAAGISVFPRLVAADLCRAGGCRPKVE